MTFFQVEKQTYACSAVISGLSLGCFLVVSRFSSVGVQLRFGNSSVLLANSVASLTGQPTSSARIKGVEYGQISVRVGGDTRASRRAALALPLDIRASGRQLKSCILEIISVG